MIHQEKSPDTFEVFLRGIVVDSEEAERKMLKEAGIKGVKFHPEYQGFFVDDEKIFPIYETLFKEDFIIIFHAGVDLGFKEPYHCTPSRLKKVLDTFPGCMIIAAHMGGYRYWNDVEK